MSNKITKLHERLNMETGEQLILSVDENGYDSRLHFMGRNIQIVYVECKDSGKIKFEEIKFKSGLEGVLRGFSDFH